MIIKTHTHGDHTGINKASQATVVIVGQENTKTNMAKMDAFSGDKAQFLPKRMYSCTKDKVSVGSEKNRLDLYYSTLSWPSEMCSLYTRSSANR